MSSNTSLHALLAFYLFLRGIDGVVDNVTIAESERLLTLIESYQTEPMYLIYVLDSSGSVGESGFKTEIDFVDQSSKFFPVAETHTRLAVVTYSSATKTPINYIENPEGKNKCTLQKDIDEIIYHAGGTATRLGLEKAYDILPKDDLPNVSRLVMLLTDGNSNSGGDPVDFAKTMRSEGIIIISVALGTNVNYAELRGVAGDEKHLIRLETLEYLEVLSNKLRGDTKDISSWELVPDDLCDSPCDLQKSRCACPLESGTYGCACKPGYTGSGQCSPCDIGYYKSLWGEQACDKCPTNHDTEKTGATDRSQCECSYGYEKDSQDDCQAVTCDVLTTNLGVEKVSLNCGNTLNDVCLFKCATNYKLTGGDESRVCQPNTLWSGHPLQCTEMVCEALPDLEYGIRNCSNSKLSIGTECHMACEEGYSLSSPDAIRTCENEQEMAVWSGNTLTCEPVRCPAMKIPKANVILQPDECLNSTLPYTSICSISCVDGYSLMGPKTRMCQANQTWSDSDDITKCKDNEPPVFQNCPQNITASTDPLKNTAKVTWDDLVIEDNSGEKPKVKHITIPTTTDQEFAIGHTEVRYKAKDAKNNKGTCKFNVTVIDTESPAVISCPIDIERESSQSTINVTWEEPKFKDNSEKFTSQTNRHSGSQFYQWEAFIVSYKVEDEAGNTAFCNFSVTVKPYSCPFQAPPANGAIAYDSWSGGQIYRIYCHAGYQFSRTPEESYFCSDGEWVLAPPFNDTKAELTWPDCSAADNGSLSVDMELQYFTGSCPAEGGQQVQEDFFNFSKILSETIPDFCDADCSAENVKVTCGPVDDLESVAGRRKRQSSRQLAYTIQFSIQLPISSEGSQDLETLERTVDGLKNAVITGELPYTVAGVPLTPSEDIYVGETTITCRTGQIRKNDLCVNCPVGTFYKDGLCVRCEKGFYQDEEAQLSCIPCPEGSLTQSEYAKSSLECKAPCKPGTLSETGMESCLACPVGTYQGRGSQTLCVPCPSGLTTPLPGATSLEQCQGHCKPGSYSPSGLTPCTPCPFGTYQPLGKQSTCLACRNGTYTPVEGAWAKEFCQVIDECQNPPCLNNGLCRDLEKGYDCMCLKGFTGVNCEININDCAPGICKNSGTCVDQDNGFICICPTGFKGRICEVNIDDCKQNRCHDNSVCVDGLNSYTCKCVAGFTGQFCEVNYDDCANAPCVNGGTCFDHIGNFTCCCPPGYEGWTCAEEVDECHPRPCQNGGHCIDALNSYQCLCQPGYVGLDCEVELDECHNVTCSNGGSCEDLVNDYKCSCPLGFIGTHCQDVLSSNFDLLFSSAKVSDYAIYRDLPDLYAFTISFWMETSDTENYGTPISYATTGLDGSVIDNAITLINYNSFILDINGEHIYTGVKANDGTRHHICITWDSLDGSWSIYLDEVSVNNGRGVQSGNFIKGGGTFVIGQEQDSLGGSFVKIEAFVGRISQVNVFDYVITANQRSILFTSCGMYGNALAWPLIATAVQGDLTPAYSSPICQSVDNCFVSPCLNGGSCENNGLQYTCHCPIGYQGLHCELASLYCDEQSCANGALCHDGSSGVLCICQPGYDGVRCENMTDMCMVEQMNCLNGGQCITKDGKAVCDCPVGWTGNVCQYDLNECLQNNGNCDHQCFNNPGSFYCVCSVGFALQPDGTTCQDVSFCRYEGILYLAGETWSDGMCSECGCVDGRAECVKRKCPVLECAKNEQLFDFPGTCCPSCMTELVRCTVLSKGKLWTFDDHSFDSKGDCRYTMATDYVTGNFSVQVEHNQYFTKRAVYLTLDCITVHVNFSGSVTVNGVPVKLPYLHGNPKNVHITGSGSLAVTVVTSRGMKILWKENGKVIVYVPKHYHGKMAGLCGNMNNDKMDDMMTRQMLPAKSTEELVHSWKVEGYTHCKEESKDKSVSNVNEQFPACIGKPPYVMEHARTQCLDLMMGPLSDCHQSVHPQEYYSLCIQDSCVCGVNKPCYCESLTAYILECQRQNVALQNYNWKSSTCGMSCGPGFVYDDCGPSPECRPTCYDDDKKKAACGQRQCEPGCHCPAARVLHGDRCIKRTDCPSPL